jgi:hypothetical protein
MHSRRTEMRTARGHNTVGSDHDLQYSPIDASSAFSHWRASDGATLLKLTSSSPVEFDRLARSVWFASWRARGRIDCDEPACKEE